MKTVSGSVKLQPNLQENTSEFIIYQGNADITGSNSFILYDSLIVYVQSIFQISYINSTITTTLPLINTSPLNIPVQLMLFILVDLIQNTQV